MFVNTNVAALNAWLNLDNTQSDMTSVLQQLSSGLKINSAADNPSGLAIAQQMQSEISGMNQAYQNAQAGISLFQTADSALSQIQSILQSMRSLASQAATGTENSTDLQSLQQEMNQYSAEVTQITNDTNFNTLNLLGGNLQNTAIQIGPDQGQSLGVSISAADAYTLGVTGLTATLGSAGDIVTTGGLGNNVSIQASGYTPPQSGNYTLSASVQNWYLSNITGKTADFTNLTGTYKGTTADTLTVKVDAVTSGAPTQIDVTDANTKTTTTYAVTSGAATINVNGSSMTLNLATTGVTAGDTFSLTVNPTVTTFTLKDPGGNQIGTSQAVNGVLTSGQVQDLAFGNGAVSFAVGATLASDTSTSETNTAAAPKPASVTAASSTFSLSQDGSAASSYTNGTGNATAPNGLDITNQTFAQVALTVLGNAINTVSTDRATIGAYQNRLQFAASDLQSSSQNLTSARAQIMDADIAQGMSNLTRDQVLQQSGVAMLAQANAMPRALLKLIP